MRLKGRRRSSHHAMMVRELRGPWALAKNQPRNRFTVGVGSTCVRPTHNGSREGYTRSCELRRLTARVEAAPREAARLGGYGGTPGSRNAAGRRNGARLATHLPGPAESPNYPP